MRRVIVLRSVIWGSFGAFGLLAVYFSVLTLVSGFGFTADQFTSFWRFVVALAVGFGIQIGLYGYLKGIVHSRNGSGKVLAVSGTTSTAAMVSCCAHYLVNILPLIGVAGVVSLIGQYQVELFWFGIVFNLAGIGFISSKVYNASKMTV